MKKNSRKLITTILLLGLLIMSFSPIVAQAETTVNGSIRLENAISGQTYSLFRVFDLSLGNIGTKSSPEYAYTYTAVTEELETQIKGHGDWKVLDSGKIDLKGRMIIDETQFSADGGSAPVVNIYDFSKWLSETQLDNLKLESSQTNAEETTSSLFFLNLDLGYYLLKSTQGSIVSLDTTNKDIYIQEKNILPSLDKKVKGGSAANYSKAAHANIGEELDFEIKFQVQEHANMDYILTDILPNGLTYAEGLTVSGANSLEEKDYTIVSGFNNTGAVEVEFNGEKRNVKDTDRNEVSGKNKVLAIKFPLATIQKFRGETITITYKAKLNESAAMSNHTEIVNNKNDAALQYDTLKDGDSEFGLARASAEVRTTEFEVFKYRDDDQPLAGASFKVYDENSNEIELKFTKPASEREEYFHAPQGASGTVSEITSTTGGKFTLKGLKPGSYYLKETKTPAGYNGLQGRVKLEITEEIGEEDSPSKIIYTASMENGRKEDVYNFDNIGVNGEGTSTNIVKVENKSGKELPSTGGAGRNLIYLGGGLLLIISFVLLVVRKGTEKA